MDVERELQAIIGKKVKDHLEPDTKLVDAGLDSLDVMELAFERDEKGALSVKLSGSKD